MKRLFRTVLVAILAAFGVRASAAVVAAVEYYDAALDHYFVTALPTEIAALDGGQFPGWTRTGQTFNVYAAGSAVPGTTPVCRFYGLPEAGLDSHFYSASPLECQQVQQRFPTAWLLESDDVFEVFMPDLDTGQCPSGSVPVYRAWNTRADSNHRYTTDLATLQAMLAKGYAAEGYGPGPAPTAMCSPSTSSGGSAPVCAPSASDVAPFVGTTVTLFANCTGNPTSFAWTGCSGGGRCDATSDSPGTLTYTVSASNVSGTSAPASIMIHWRSLPAAPACAMVVTSNTVPPVIGSTALLDAVCSNAPASYNWSGCTSGGPLCAAESGSPGVVSYSVSASNAGGIGPPASRSLSWVVSTPPAPGLCSQYPSYLMSDLGWVSTQVNSRDYANQPGFAWNGVWVIKLSVPGDASSAQLGRMTIAEFGGPIADRELTISRVPCDFRPNDPTGNNGPLLREEGQTATVHFGIGGSGNGDIGLAPGVDYYVNIRNWDAQSSTISCNPAGPRCDAFFFILLP